MTVHLSTFAARRLGYAGLAAVLLVALVFEIVQHGAWGPALLGAAGPDLSMAFGGGRGLAHGQLHPRAVGLYNAVHRFWAPLALMAAASAGLLGVGWFVAGLAWAFHIALDRSVGYDLRDRRGFQRAR